MEQMIFNFSLVVVKIGDHSHEVPSSLRNE